MDFPVYILSQLEELLFYNWELISLLACSLRKKVKGFNFYILNKDVETY
jgi:hypothetical protein